jgi:hypothetical protein
MEPCYDRSRPTGKHIVTYNSLTPFIRPAFIKRNWLGNESAEELREPAILIIKEIENLPENILLTTARNTYGITPIGKFQINHNASRSHREYFPNFLPGLRLRRFQLDPFEEILLEVLKIRHGFFRDAQYLGKARADALLLNLRSVSAFRLSHRVATYRECKRYERDHSLRSHFGSSTYRRIAPTSL